MEDVPLQALREQQAQVAGVWGRDPNDNFSLSVEPNHRSNQTTLKAEQDGVGYPFETKES